MFIFNSASFYTVPETHECMAEIAMVISHEHTIPLLTHQSLILHIITREHVVEKEVNERHHQNAEAITRVSEDINKDQMIGRFRARW